MAYLDNTIQIGPPCGSCGLFSLSHSLNNGVGYCERGYAWQSANARPWNCQDHLPQGLQHALRRLDRTLGRLEIQIRIENGSLCGTVDDPQIPTLNKRGYDRMKKHLEATGGSFEGWEPRSNEYAR